MLFYPWGPVVLSWLCFVFIGFVWGRRQGRKEGALLGQREAPLLLREASLLAGHCVLCQQPAPQQSSEPNFDLAARISL
jgi:hypothetical protein